MISEFAALVLGLIEGFTEFLPISSTAHLVLASQLLGIAQSSFAKSFEISIQSGAILAVLFLYWKKFVDPGILKKIATAFIPTGIIGFLFYKFVINNLLGDINTILWALGAGGILLILFEIWQRRKKPQSLPEAGVEEISYKQAFGVGIFQAIAIIPGVSRAAATIIGGMLLGVRRGKIVEFSFLLAVPTMLAATGLDLAKNLHSFSISEFWIIAIGFTASMVTAVVSIKFLLRYIKNHTFIGFGVYRVILALAFLVLVVL